MLLVIDIGNTNVKLGIFDQGKMKSSFRIATSLTKTADEYGISVKNLFSTNNVELSSVTDIIISSVIPSLNYTFEHMCKYYFKTAPILFTPDMDSGLTLEYDNPKELGTDRIADCVAGKKEYGYPLIIVDFGTTTTFNVINAHGTFSGGLIFAGMKVTGDAVTNSAARLPHIELIKPQNVVGKNTVSNLQNGLFYGFVGLVQHIIGLIEVEENIPNAKVIATGGMSEFLRQGTDVFESIDRELTMKGLYYIHKHLTKKIINE